MSQKTKVELLYNKSITNQKLSDLKKIVIIEDESNIAELLALHLKDIGCQSTHFIDGEEGCKYVLANKPDLLVLDINLPGKNGLEICKEIRENGMNVPIIMLTARTEEQDKITGLELGADDYITKPFSIKEFLARVKAVCRRWDADKSESEEIHQVIRSKEMMIDREKRIVTLNNERLELTPKEFDLLYLLASNKGVTYDRKKLLNLVWGYDFEGYEHTVNTHINRLRAKVELDPNDPKYVLTTWGVGYRFNDE